MTNLYGYTTSLFSTPYITVDEYKQAPTAIDYDNLVSWSTDPAVQNAELANNIARASSWVDTYCNQVLAATTEVEQGRARLRSDGMIAIHPEYFPIVALTAFSYGITPNDMVQYPDPSQGWVEKQEFILPYTSANIMYSSQGPLQFGLPAIPRAQVYCQYTYISGYANTLLSANYTAGATTITVDNPVGIVAGTRMTIYEGLSTETVTVAPSYVFGSNTVPLASGLVYNHTQGFAVSALPPAVKEATILATTALLKVRGDYSLVMQQSSQVGSVSRNSVFSSNDLELAMELLKPFRRIR